MFRLLRRQRQWSQPKPNTHIRSITPLISDVCSQWNWKDAISAKNCLFFPPLLLTTEPEIRTEWAQWKHTTWGQARLLDAGGSVGGGIICHWVSLSRGSVLPQEMERAARWDPSSRSTYPECISMSTKMSLPTTNSASFSDLSWQILAEDPVSVSR